MDRLQDDPANSLALSLALLHRCNSLIIRLRRALHHDHGDQARWLTWRITAREAQALRARLRSAADCLHVERATARGRVHSARFTSLDEQRAWLERHAGRRRLVPDGGDEDRLSSLP